MKKSLLILTFFFILFIVDASSQENRNIPLYKNQLGFQLNPYFDQQFFDFNGHMNTVAALRYGNRITRNVTAGMELSCSFPINLKSTQNFQIFDYYSYRINLYSRYSIFPEKRYNIFAEASPYFSHLRREWTSTNDHSPYIIQKFGYYVAPGLTLCSKNRRISLDLFYKFSNLLFINGNKSVFSYKVNYNF